ncbi:ABC transporter permease [Clostridium grantii]|uniref:Osmoprotectant transport system permease protein n=1 Tax=Clostridium grantii DSM 8605 TaxID=1121316 RepID=A0A1M5XM46_9CLOT|nr:ABC transporter permease [Clostridium grantii]SHI00900.1 osmoprotectant transport system permease protein [Clostridium grantii DSM 8605]
MIKGILQLYVERWDFFLELILQHMMLTLIAVLIITITGIALGIVMTRNEVLAKILLTITNFLYTIPSIALFGFLVSITGIGNSSAIIALSIYGILPIIRNTYTGIMEVDDQVIESAVGMGVTNSQLLLKIQLPLASPVIMTGFRTMVIMTIALGGIASFIGAGGLGKAIWRGITTNYPEMTIGGSLLVALLAIVTDFLLEIVEKKLRKRILGNGSMGGSLNV